MIDWSLERLPFPHAYSDKRTKYKLLSELVDSQAAVMVPSAANLVTLLALKDAQCSRLSFQCLVTCMMSRIRRS